MATLTTTLAQLRKAHACVDGYNRLVRALKGEPFTTEDEERTTHLRFTHKGEIPLSFILEANGLDDALWALRASNCSERDARFLTVAFARDVEHLMPEDSRFALAVAERFANGQATAQELAKASSVACAAWHVADDAACTACTTYAAYDDATCIAYAAYAAYVACAACDDVADAAFRAAYYARTTCDTHQRQTDLFLQLCQGTPPWHTQP